MGKITVVYFNGRGRAEPIRLVLKAAGIDFEDRRVEFSEWPALKPKSPSGQMPYVILADGKEMSDSLAIARYFAFEYGFMGNGHGDIFLTERAIGCASDIFDGILQVHFAQDAEKAKKKEEFIAGKGRTGLKNLSKFLNEKGPFFIGDKVSLGDFVAMNVWDTLKKNFGDLTKDFPQFDKHHAAICKACPNVATHIAQRPDTAL